MYEEETIKTNGMIINDAIDYISELFAGNSDGHGADHTMRVYHNVHILLEAYPEADSFVVSLDYFHFFSLFLSTHIIWYSIFSFLLINF